MVFKFQIYSFALFNKELFFVCLFALSTSSAHKDEMSVWIRKMQQSLCEICTVCIC